MSIVPRPRTWGEFAEESPDLASFGSARFSSRVAYLATVRDSLTPRVHPFTPLLVEDRLFCFMRRSSPKGKDLRLNGRFAIHAGVEDEEGGSGEFWIAGPARAIDHEPQLRRRVAAGAGYDVLPDDSLFEFLLLTADCLVYGGEGPGRLRWRADVG
jgi:hypothetical protein